MLSDIACFPRKISEHFWTLVLSHCTQIAWDNYWNCVLERSWPLIVNVPTSRTFLNSNVPFLRKTLYCEFLAHRRNVICLNKFCCVVFRTLRSSCPPLCLMILASHRSRHGSTSLQISHAPGWGITVLPKIPMHVWTTQSFTSARLTRISLSCPSSFPGLESRSPDLISDYDIYPTITYSKQLI
jgi:hypothetical protein